jgi:pimeloyl-ACP methyl ester carboxylesterase
VAGVTAPREHVVLLHGLWMRGFTLIALRRRLETAGFSVDLFDYASVMQDSLASIRKLLAHTATAAAGKVHFVGHSLGGLLALKTLEHCPGLIEGRVVCIGSPLTGSSVARALAGFPCGPLLLGRNLDLLQHGLARWQGAQQVSSIAGRLQLGFGAVVGTLGAPHDGTVSVEETVIQGLTAHRVISASHTGLLFSSEAAILAANFLRHGSFPPDTGSYDHCSG